MQHFFNSYFTGNRFTFLMTCLVAFIGLCVYSFSLRYMKGDSRYRRFLIKLFSLVILVVLTVCSNNLILFFILWCLSNALLVRMMVHKSSWKAALASGKLAGTNYALGAVFLACAFLLFYSATGNLNISLITQQARPSTILSLGLSLTLLAAMTQSAIWPFHRWLISSLNSPTPVSAIMHAGLVNGGGILLVRFAPLLFKQPFLLTIMFAAGVITASLGTLWKLLQNDIKRMLACSTMGQMGFMLAQCGLGLFPAAISHLICHSLFKAYLFLASASTSQQKRFHLQYPPKPWAFLLSLVCGLAGSLSFGYVSGKSWLSGDTTLFLMVIAFIASSQLALTFLEFKSLRQLPVAILLTVGSALIYGLSFKITSFVMEPLHLLQPQPLNLFHILGIAIFILIWLSFLFWGAIKHPRLTFWMTKFYVNSLNSSQPHSDTITTHRNQYSL